jgi:hypothetical protein
VESRSRAAFRRPPQRQRPAATARKRRLAVLESDWFEGYNHSVRGFYEGLSRAIYETADGFHYERFVGRASLEDAMRHLVAKRDVRYVYLASHGETSYIRCPNRERIKRDEFARMLGELAATTRLDGLYFASCLFGSKRTGELLLGEGSRTRRLKWIAGYTTSVDWIESMALDWLFWNYVLAAEGDTASPHALISDTVDYVVQMAPELCRQLRFHVYVRRGPGVVDLVAERLAARPRALLRAA